MSVLSCIMTVCVSECVDLCFMCGRACMCEWAYILYSCVYGEGALIHSSGKCLWGGTVRSTEVAKGIPLGQMTIERMWVLVGPKVQVASSRLSQKAMGNTF